jgi:hypothetical protein
MLPSRDRQLAAFERWLEERITFLTDHPRDPITCPTIQPLAPPETTPCKVPARKKHELRRPVSEAGNPESGRFLAWLQSEHYATYTGIRQSHIDDYLSSGPSTRHAIRTFIAWLVASREIAKIQVPHREAQSTPILTQATRISHNRTGLTAGDLPTTDRMAALILLLYANPVGKIAALKATAIEARPDGLYLHLGSVPALLPSQVAETFWNYLQHRPNQKPPTRTVRGSSPAPCPATTLIQRACSKGFETETSTSTASETPLSPTSPDNSIPLRWQNPLVTAAR